ncbi:MAG: MaoC family dehydratase N-terminal domain-containing protein [Dehalococcoidia bacterium]|jgi:acyl dehydratase|nr:MaoC family dehydratase N-terminal domain-containing protein [Dehalococcoidia bacterium]
MAEANPMDAIDFDRSVIGIDVDVGTHEVSKEQMVAYAKAVGEINPLYLDEEAAKAGPYGTIIAPPLFYNMLSLQPGLDPRVKFGTSGFDAGQHAEFFEPIRAGDTISAKTQVADVYAKTGRTGTMVFTIRRTTYTNQKYEKTVVVDRISVRRDLRQ